MVDINRHHIAHHCHEVAESIGGDGRRRRSRGDHQAMIFSILWKFAHGLREIKFGDKMNPARDRPRTYKSKPRLAWPIEVQRRFIEGASPRMQLAFALAFYTAQRRGDVCRMKWSDYDGKRLIVTQEKTGKRIPVRVHRELLLILNNMPRVSDHILTTVTGKPIRDKSALSKAVQARLQEIGEPKGKYVLHGIRHTAGVRLATIGMGTKQIMAMLGHASAGMSLHYQKQADELKLIDDVVEAWERAA